MYIDILNFIKLNHQSLDLIIDMVPIPVFIKNREGRYIDCNIAFEKYLSINREQIIGKTVYDLWKKEEADVFFAKDEELFNQGGGQMYETKVTSLDGNNYVVQFNKQVFTDASGVAMGLLGVIFDITDLKNKEDEINKLLKEKETILREAHHRIKNNMSSVLGLIKLRSSAEMPKEIKNIFEDVKSQLVGMCTLYDKLYQSPSTEQIELGDYLTTLFKEVIEVISNGMLIKLNINIPVIQVSSKSAANLGIIFNELITNSIKYAFGRTTSPQISLDGHILDDKLLLDYKDNGIGISENFNFNSTSGFGMTVIKELTKSLSGEIKVVPVDNGTFFHIKIPVEY